MRYYSDGAYFMRPVGEGDLPLLTEHRNDEATWAGLTNVFPKYHHDQLKWLASMNQHNMYFMAEENLSTVGIIRITDIDFQNGNACVGLDIFSGFRAQGRALPVFKMAVKYCFDVLRLHRVWLLVKEGNTPAIKTYRKAGFRLEGAMRQHLYRDGLYHDYLLYGLLREEWERDRTAV